MVYLLLRKNILNIKKFRKKHKKFIFVRYFWYETCQIGIFLYWCAAFKTEWCVAGQNTTHHHHHHIVIMQILIPLQHYIDIEFYM